MADIRVRFTLNTGAYRAMKGPQGMIGSAVANAAETTVRRAQNNVTRYGRVKTGEMRSRIKARPVRVLGDGVSAEVVAEAAHSIFQHQGTRRGIRPAPFLTDALKELRPSDFHT